jgi:ABC-type amino acid transport substrate-binding protein
MWANASQSASSRSDIPVAEYVPGVAIGGGGCEREKWPLVTKLNEGITAIRADGAWKQINDRWAGR